jgi:hypothetical protein
MVLGMKIYERAKEILRNFLYAPRKSLVTLADDKEKSILPFGHHRHAALGGD